MDVDVAEVIDRYDERREERGGRLLRFYTEDRPDFLILQHPAGTVWQRCNTVEEVYESNLRYCRDALEVDHTDDLPFLEPWVGTGVYANAFGCEYVFRDGDSPHVRYRYHAIDEVADVEYPDYRKSPIMDMVLDSIDCFKERTRQRLPIALTDTQSPFDTATLVVDACELYAACYTHESVVAELLQKITDLIVEFSRVQIDRIGDALVARPGHSMPSLLGAPGFSISDDNLAVASPRVNRRFALPYDRQLADALGPLAIHSCGTWTHTMPAVRDMGGVMAIECAVGEGRDEGQAAGLHDPAPNNPAEVRRSLAGSPIITKARPGDNLEKTLAMLDDLVDPGRKLIVEIPHHPEDAEFNYRRIEERLRKWYNA